MLVVSFALKAYTCLSASHRQVTVTKRARSPCSCIVRLGPQSYDTVDGGNLAPLLQRRLFTAPYPLLNIGIENLQKQICSNDGNLAPPQTEQLSMLKRGCGDALSSHRTCLLRR